MAERADRLVLIGFATTGKSTVGRLVADRLGWEFVDTDALVEEAAGRTIAAIFESDGEAAFRALESQALQRALDGHQRVIATGGGIVIDPANRECIAANAICLALAASPDTVLKRLERQRQDDPATIRPLLNAADPRARIDQLRAERAAWYTLADWTVHTDLLTVAEVAAEVVRGFQTIVRAGRTDPAEVAARVITGSASYPVVVGSGVLDHLGRWCREVGLSGRAFVIADAHASDAYRRQINDALRREQFEVVWTTVPSGEASKDLEVAAGLFGWLADHRAERREAIIAVGGGVTGDLAGYVAAAYLRGMPLVQVPTTLLAMTDSSIGGKVAVNLPAGKNLVGAFHQPKLVLADVTTLATLPRRDVVAGWAETLKHALIGDPNLLEQLERDANRLLALDMKLLPSIIGQSAAVKVRVVSADEREDGPRLILNYGHTIGHAIEASGDYATYLHGEAVAVGMRGVARIAVEMGILDPAVADRQARLLERFGLPTTAPNVAIDRVRTAMKLDKKVSGKSIRWVLLRDVGNPVIRSDVPDTLVDSTIRELIE